VTTLKDEEIGFLKGNLKEKMEPFMYSFMHNFEKVIGKANLELLRNAGMIEELPIAYMRGINIDNSIAIIDEAQNISVDNIRTIMTRLGENSKMIFLGDENQIDMKKKSESSLNFIIDKFKDFDEVGTIVLDEDDVVRNPLIKKIEQIFREKK
jgi:phosphate starvation-inducible PhoH-like protein